MEVSVTHNQMTLTCLVQNRNSKLNIYLLCPFQSICKENCKRTCVKSNSDGTCLPDKMIQCNDKGFDAKTNSYIIEYIIDGTDPVNNGKWKCSYASLSSSVITVDVPVLSSVTTQKSIHPNMTKNAKPAISKQTTKGWLL